MSALQAQQPQGRADYPHMVKLQTRWADNDIYGHVNNATYYAYFDTVVNNFLSEHGGFDIVDAPITGLAVETMCRFKSSVAYPETIELGLRIGKLGTTSVRYELAVFRLEGAMALASGHFVHVFVERSTSKPVPVPGQIRAAFECLMDQQP